MANGEDCKHCGYQETDHDLERAVKPNGRRCYRFVSVVRHKRGCPVIDSDMECNGRHCNEMIRRKKLQEESAGQAPAILLITPHGTLYAGD